ncbi:MAG: c-type cytochrome [Fidelibacterota bacterium]
MTTKQKDVLLSHDYDGIQELDNDLPPWWLYLFYLSIIFSVVYMVHYHVTGTGDLMIEEYRKELNPAASSFFDISYHSPYYKRGATVVKETTGTTMEEAVTEEEPVLALSSLTDEASLAKGKSIYTTNCAVCHGPQGEGGIGPNMTDNYYIHGGTINDMVKIINVGVPAKGMIPWDKTLTPEQILEVASYLVTLRNTNVPNGKAPQGEAYRGE